MKAITISLHKDRNVTLTALLQETGGEYGELKTRPAIIVLPGGGYSMCSDREADPAALAYAKEGFQVFILRYTVSKEDKEHLWPYPIQDYEDAYEVIRSNAQEWAVDMERIAVCGFSAGGHLAACAATLAANRPSAAILGYPAILPPVVDVCAKRLPYPCEHVDEKTSPCFIFAARDDNVVNVKSSTAFADALEAKGVNYEMHVYSYGGHGFSTGEACLNTAPLSQRVQNWVSDSVGFLSEVWGSFTASGFTKPRIGRTVNGDHDAYLSVRCTVGHLERQTSGARAAIADELAAVDAVLAAQGYTGEAADYLKNMFTLQTLLAMAGTPVNRILALDNALAAFKNEE